MKERTETTRELLIITAGKLFAQLGLDGVSTRMITDKANLKLSSIHYHFGSKENLYIEACRYAKNKGITVTFLTVMDENPTLLNHPEGQAEIIRNTVFRRFHEYFRPERPTWEIQIIARETLSPSSALPVLADQLFKPEVDAAINFYKRLRPNASDLEAYSWCDLFFSPLFFYSMAHEPIRLIRGENALSDDFMKEASRNLSRALLLLLDLPIPQDLK